MAQDFAFKVEQMHGALTKGSSDKMSGGQPAEDNDGMVDFESVIACSSFYFTFQK